MNADKEKYLDYETNANSDLTENVCMRCHDSKELNSFGVPRKFKCNRGGYARVTSPEKLVWKENANLKLLADEEGQLHADGKTLSVDRFYHHPPTITVQQKEDKYTPATSCNISCLGAKIVTYVKIMW